MDSLLNLCAWIGEIVTPYALAFVYIMSGVDGTLLGYLLSKRFRGVSS